MVARPNLLTTNQLMHAWIRVLHLSYWHGSGLEPDIVVYVFVYLDNLIIFIVVIHLMNIGF